MLLGPNTGLGHNSVVLMIEAQVRYAMECLKMMKRKKQRVLEVRPENPAVLRRRNLPPHDRHRVAIRRLQEFGIKTNPPVKSPPSGPAPSSPTSAARARFLPPTTD